MNVLWILVPSPFVGYLMIDSVRKIFSEDERLLRRLFSEQPVTMIAAATALGAMPVWAVSEVILRYL